MISERMYRALLLVYPSVNTASLWSNCSGTGCDVTVVESEL